MSSAEREDIEQILAELDLAEPVSFDLGTPDLQDVDAVWRLVALGPPIVPRLLEQIRERGIPKKRIAYVVLALARLDGIGTMPALCELRERFQRREFKDEWDYAVIGQCNLAIKEIERNDAQ